MSADLVEQCQPHPAPACAHIDGVGPTARISAALDDIALSLAARHEERAALIGTYADGYFSALCFVVGVLTDEPATSVASPRAAACQFA